MTKTVKFVLLCSFFLPCLSFGQVVVVSDIDDSIKVSHVLDNWDSFRRAYDTESFWQMPELYEQLWKYGAELFYISNAPKELMEGSHSRFLIVNNYPVGYLLLPRYSEREGHKIRQIEKIIADRRPRILILLGDNGEKDSEVYAFITEKYKNSGIRFLTFIRMDYNYDDEGVEPLAGQKTFVTAGEVALVLNKFNILPTDVIAPILKSSLSHLGFSWRLKELIFPGASLGLPDWVDCRKHNVDLQEYYGISPDVKVLENKIQTRCSYVID